MALQPFAQDGNPVMKSIDQDPNLRSAMGNRFQQSWGCLCAIFSTLTNLTWLTNLLTGNSHLWPPHTSRQQSMHLFRPKMSRQLSVVDLIQQYLPTRRWHHQSRLLFCALKYQFKPVFGHNMKLSMIPMCFLSQLPHFNVWKIPHGLINTCQERWFHNQQWNKGLNMIPNSKNTRINTLTTSWVVISHSKCWTINWKSWNKQTIISQLAFQYSQRIS